MTLSQFAIFAIAVVDGAISLVGLARAWVNHIRAVRRPSRPLRAQLA
jgi:hypothetical protein